MHVRNCILLTKYIYLSGKIINSCLRVWHFCILFSKAITNCSPPKCDCSGSGVWPTSWVVHPCLKTMGSMLVHMCELRVNSISPMSYSSDQQLATAINYVIRDAHVDKDRGIYVFMGCDSCECSCRRIRGRERERRAHARARQALSHRAKSPDNLRQAFHNKIII